MSAQKSDSFFVGYLREVPPAIARFALLAGLAMAGGLIGAAFALAIGTGDPGSGHYSNDLQGGVLTGVIDPTPYPILRTFPAPGAPARAVLLGGQIKMGAQATVAKAGGGAVTVGGVFVKRGDLTMLLVGGNDVKPATAAPFQPAAAQPLGRWKLTGEICDGKCYAGSMKPGTGLAHKACASLCVSGGLPPVLVMALPVEGSTVVLLADKDGGPMPAALLHVTAVPIEMEGTLERRDDLLIFRIDPGTARAL